MIRRKVPWAAAPAGHWVWVRPDQDGTRWPFSNRY